MLKVAHALRHFLMSNRIDPDSVNVVLRAKDDDTLHRLEAAIKMEMRPMEIDFRNPPDVRKMKLLGMQFMLGTLDKSR